MFAAACPTVSSSFTSSLGRNGGKIARKLQAYPIHIGFDAPSSSYSCHTICRRHGVLSQGVLVTTQTFRLLAVPYIYTDFSLFDRQHRGRLDEPSEIDLLAMTRSFLLGITTGGGRCAQYVKRIRLPGSGLLRRAQRALFRAILKLVPNLKGLQVYSSRRITSAKPFNLRTLLVSPPSFQLRSFGWYARGDLE